MRMKIFHKFIIIIQILLSTHAKSQWYLCSKPIFKHQRGVEKIVAKKLTSVQYQRLRHQTLFTDFSRFVDSFFFHSLKLGSLRNLCFNSLERSRVEKFKVVREKPVFPQRGFNVFCVHLLR